MATVQERKSGKTVGPEDRWTQKSEQQNIEQGMSNVEITDPNKVPSLTLPARCPRRLLTSPASTVSNVEVTDADVAFLRHSAVLLFDILLFALLCGAWWWQVCELIYHVSAALPPYQMRLLPFFPRTAFFFALYSFHLTSKRPKVLWGLWA
jgi:hypothetical protein